MTIKIMLGTIIALVVFLVAWLFVPHRNPMSIDPSTIVDDSRPDHIGPNWTGQPVAPITQSARPAQQQRVSPRNRSPFVDPSSIKDDSGPDHIGPRFH